MPKRKARSGSAPRGDETFEDDEREVARLLGRSEREKQTRKLQQLCRQVERAAWFALGEQGDEPSLAGACVVGVHPAPDQARLRVLVAVPHWSSRESTGRGAAVERLRASMRRESAALLHRKRVPELVVELRPREEGGA